MRTETKADVVITLVHGTWARSSRWTKAGSKLYQQLALQVRGEKLVTHFPWSGNNSPNARTAAAKMLSVHLRDLVQEHPHAKHFVIGHSHGGNVALKAVEFADLFQKIQVICLSTPFFNVKPRFTKLSRPEERVIVYSLYGMALLPSVFRVHVPAIPSVVKYIALAVFFLCLILLSNTWKKSAENFRSGVELRVPDFAKLLIVRTVGDEATAVIAMFQIVTWFMTKLGVLYIRLLSWPLRVVDAIDARTAKPMKKIDKIAGRTMIGLALIAAIVEGYFSWFYHRDILDEYSQRLSLWFASTWVAHLQSVLAPYEPAVAVSLASPVILLGIAILAGSSLPIGFGALVGAMVHEVTVEPVPVGKWLVYQVRPEQEGEGLMHSTSYENEVALAAISDWINASCEDVITSPTNNQKGNSSAVFE